MADWDLEVQIFEELCGLPLLDAHSHLVGGKLAARGLHDILLYHMAVSELYAAGCPSGQRLTQYPGWPDREEAHRRLAEAVPFLPLVRNTSVTWGVRQILKDLYGWQEPVHAGNWRQLDDLVRERADDRAWPRAVMRRTGILRAGTEYARREGGADGDALFYALEWAFFTRCQWGEYDTALYELERCWGREPESPTPIGPAGRPPAERTIRTVEDVHEALAHYVDRIPVREIVATATHISMDIDLSPVTEGQMRDALARRSEAGPRDRDIYASYIHEAYLNELERRAWPLVFQFSFGAEPLPHETASRLSTRAVAQLAETVSRHPGIRFQCFLASRHANQALCTLCRELPNLSLIGYWWHNCNPSAMRQVMEERLDLLPLNRHVGFISDAYCVEWAYAKAQIVRRVLATVLARKVLEGQHTRAEAIDIAAASFYTEPVRLLGLDTATH
ncbi:MAG TPA: hypothetical protein VLH79_13030 [Chthonomonadales bacterium]|nr:hypothetical protein [Chthonomonadales bacterium]